MASVTPQITSLDPSESAVESPHLHAIDHARYGSIDWHDTPHARPAEQHFRHSGWAHRRDQTYAALKRVGSSERILDAFANCGNSLWLGRDGSEICLLSNHCHNRHCEACARAKRARLVEGIRLVLLDAKARCRFITLTLKCQPVPLLDQLDRLLACFRRLRQRTWWKSTVTGGAFFVEIKLGANSGAWHVHLHLLVEGKWVDQKQLSSEWHAVTGDSYIVDVRSIAEDARVASYVAKYATKPLHSAVFLLPDKLDECIIAVRGRRLLNCFGSWKSLTLDDDAPPCRPTMLGRVDALFDAAAGGDQDARRWVEAALRKWPTLAVFSPHPTPANTDPAPP